MIIKSCYIIIKLWKSYIMFEKYLPSTTVSYIIIVIYSYIGTYVVNYNCIINAFSSTIPSIDVIVFAIHSRKQEPILCRLYTASEVLVSHFCFILFVSLI